MGFRDSWMYEWKNSKFDRLVLLNCWERRKCFCVWLLGVGVKCSEVSLFHGTDGNIKMASMLL